MTDTPGNQPPQFDPSQPYAPPAPPFQPYPHAVAPSPKKGPSALKIVLIVVGIFVGLGLIGLGFLSYEVYKVVKTSHLATNTHPVTESDLGVALYPGARQGKTHVRMTIAGKNVLTANFVTSDARDRVIAFYKEKLGSDARTSATANGESFVLNKGAGESVIVSVSQEPNLEGGMTRIVIVHAQKATAPAM